MPELPVRALDLGYRRYPLEGNRQFAQLHALPELRAIKLAHDVQETGRMSDTQEKVKITSFAGEYSWLSNFYPSFIELDGEDYPTVEHAFQAAKTDDPDERANIRLNPSPVTAKHLGKRVTLRPGWDDLRFGVMETFVRQKFTRYADLRAKLLATGDAELIEGNTWRDTTWGAVWNKDKGYWAGKNHLGKILMKVRDELKER
jgi:ribA/ribD-fused uncharacterized protein